ncbi:hypothetical protein ACH5RR_015132 [Cinchona calisaya]|uniref:Dof zinc finger protein n=1 Tax=Cinchona calisaya TaxID=153742 RepID=A0ABD2ZSP3_9GENT
MMDSSSKVMMEKPNNNQESQQQQQQQQHQVPLKCPRCDSSNTKFCYFNNYSLSQPRHFCKACKRYWTRGGTLRNVPVGGGCRKNKRVKRPPPSNSNEANSSSSIQQTLTSNPNPNPSIIVSSSTPNHINNPLFYSFTNNGHPSELINLPYPRFNPKISSMDSVNVYDLPPHMNDLGLGFSSGLILDSDVVVPTNSPLSSYNPIFGSSTSTSTMASLIASSLHQQKTNNVFGGLKDAQEGNNNFQVFEQFEDMQMPDRNSDQQGSLMVKDVKMEEGHNRLDHWINVANNNDQNHIEQINNSSADSSLLWNSTGIGAWLDPSNVGSSVPSLI